MTVLLVLLYFLIGWTLSRAIGKEADDVSAFVFIAWPLFVMVLIICMLFSLVLDFIDILKDWSK